MAFASSERAALLAALSLVACQGQRTPPLVGGDGVTVTTGDAVRVGLDPARVPVLPAGGCAEGELVYRASAGAWACAPAATLFADVPVAKQPVSPEVVSALEERIGDLERQLSGFDDCDPLPAAIRPPNYVLAPASCLVVDGSGLTNDAYHLEDGWLVMHRAGSVRIACALTRRCDGADDRWDTARFFVRDPDGPADTERAVVAVHQSFTQYLPPCGANRACRQTSVATGSSTLSIDLGGYTPVFDDAAAVQHYVEVELFSAGGGVAFGGVIIE